MSSTEERIAQGKIDLEEYLKENASAEELRAAFGTNRWAICRNTAANRERWGLCITHKFYRETVAQIVASRVKGDE